MNSSSITDNLASLTHSFSKYEFVNESPVVAVPILIVLVITSGIGTFGNILILVTLYTTKSLQQLECIFMASLAISDMYVTLLADPMSIVAKLEGEEFFDRIPRFCQTIASICTIACINSLGSITLLSFNRYIYICHHKYYNNIFRKWTCIAMCCCLNGVGLLFVLLNFAGIGDHSFDRKSLECIWDRMATYPYTVVYSVTLVWIPVIVVGFSYLCIFLMVRKSQQRTKYIRSKRMSSYSTGLARTLFIIYAIFSACWIPYALILVLDTHDTFPYEVHVYITVWAHLHPSVNWIVYYFTNTRFETAFNRIVHLDVLFGKCRRQKKQEGEMTSSGGLSSSETTHSSRVNKLLHSVDLTDSNTF